MLKCLLRISLQSGTGQSITNNIFIIYLLQLEKACLALFKISFSSVVTKFHSVDTIKYNKPRLVISVIIFITSLYMYNYIYLKWN